MQGALASIPGTLRSFKVTVFHVATEASSPGQLLCTHRKLHPARHASLPERSWTFSVLSPLQGQVYPTLTPSVCVRRQCC